jgi:hypothetical protein
MAKVGEVRTSSASATTGHPRRHDGAMYTVAAWGAHGRLLDRGAIVGGLDQPSVWGRRGEPRHPLYVPRVTEPTAYKTKDDGDRPAERTD